MDGKDKGDDKGIAAQLGKVDPLPPTPTHSLTVL